MNAYCVRLSFYNNKKSYIGPKLIEWNMVDNCATNIKRDAWKI